MGRGPCHFHKSLEGSRRVQTGSAVPGPTATAESPMPTMCRQRPQQTHEEQSACANTPEGEGFLQKPRGTPQCTPVALMQALSSTLQLGLAEGTEFLTQPQEQQAKDIKTTVNGWGGWPGLFLWSVPSSRANVPPICQTPSISVDHRGWQHCPRTFSQRSGGVRSGRKA